MYINIFMLYYVGGAVTGNTRRRFRGPRGPRDELKEGVSFSLFFFF